jgi:hypothetical protein
MDTVSGSPVKIYFIWYGNWSGLDSTANNVLTNFANNIGGSPYFNINTTYTNGSGTPVNNAVAFGGSVNDNYSRGTALSDGDIQTIVASHAGVDLPLDTNGVYFVLTTDDVSESTGFCTRYCGWHTAGTIGGADIKYSFVGDPLACPGACAAQSTGPNGNGVGDGMASVVAHELEEATTDPDLNAWYDATGNENADKCAWTFGTTYHSANNALANMKLGSLDYLIQQNWVDAAGGYCALSYASVPAPPAPSTPGLTAVSSSEIDLTWTEQAGSNQTGLNILRCTGSCTPTLTVGQAGATATTYHDTGLAGATTYSYIVQAFNSGGSANSGVATTATLTPPPPTAPSAPTLSVVSSSEIDLAWSGGSGQTSFNVLRCTGTCTPSASIGSVAGNVFSYKNTGLAASTTYTYAVQGVNAGGAGTSGPSIATTQAPPTLSAPSNLKASAVRTGKKRKVNLSWTNGANPGVNDDIERCDGTCTSTSGTWAQIAQVSGTSTSYSDTSVSATTTYSYRVRAQSGSMFSGYSNIQTVTTP